MSTFKGILKSVSRLQFDALPARDGKPERPAHGAISITFIGADAEGRATQYELLTTSKAAAEVVIRLDAVTGKPYSAGQLAAAKNIKGGKSVLMLHKPGIITVSGVAAGKRQVFGQDNTEGVTLTVVETISVVLNPLPPNESTELDALLGEFPAVAVAAAPAAAPQV